MPSIDVLPTLNPASAFRAGDRVAFHCTGVHGAHYFAPGTVILAGDDDVMIVPDDASLSSYDPRAERFIPREGDEIWHLNTCPGVVGHFSPGIAGGRGVVYGPENRPATPLAEVGTYVSHATLDIEGRVTFADATRVVVLLADGSSVETSDPSHVWNPIRATVKRETVRPPFKVNVWSDPEYWNPVHVNGRVVGYVGTRAYNVWSARMADGAHVWQDNGADSTRAAMVAAILAQYNESN